MTSARTPRHRLNMNAGDLDDLQRLANAQREIRDIADALFRSKTSKRADREQLGRRLNSVAASLRTVEMNLEGTP